MRKNEINETRMVVRESARKGVKNSCSLFDAKKEQLIKYIYRGTGYRKKRETANFTEQFDSNSGRSEIAEKEFCRSVDVKDRKWKTFTKKSSFFLCANLQKNKLVTERGITLLALIITVVIMLILAAVTINVTLGDGGLVQQARLAAERTQNAAEKEQAEIDSLQQELANILAEDSEITPPEPGGNNETGGDIEEPEEPSISDTETQVANYADVDGNGTVDGVIYADLAIGGSGSGLGQSYTIPTSSGFKKYKVTQESYTPEGSAAGFGTGKVIAPVDPSGSGTERFYVMALSDVDSSYHCWYYSAYSYGMSDYASQTSTAFGRGEQNTINMIAKWNSSGYGSQNGNSSYPDMWGLSAVNSRTWNGSSGWYIPSRDEWVAFAGELDIDSGNYSNHGLSDYYWSSSQYVTSRAWDAHFYFGNFRSEHVNGYCYVRLGTTF